MKTLWKKFRSALRRLDAYLADATDPLWSELLDAGSYFSILIEELIAVRAHLKLPSGPYTRIPKRVIFIRHPQTNEHDDRIYRADDAEITEKGWEEAYMVAHRIREMSETYLDGITHIVTSTFSRSRKLAELIATELATTARSPNAVLPTIIPSDLFVEIRKPSVLKNIHRDDPEAVRIGKRIRRLFDLEYRHSDEENRWRIRFRVFNLLRFLEALDAPVVVVVTHGKLLRAIYHHLWEGNMRGFYRKADPLLKHGHTGITIFDLEPGFREENKAEMQWIVQTWNELAHTDLPRDLIARLAHMP